MAADGCNLMFRQSYRNHSILQKLGEEKCQREDR